MKWALILFFILWCDVSLAAEQVTVEESKAPIFSWSGDLRLRTQAEKNGDNETRWSEKLRARFGVGIKVSNELRAEIRLATTRSNRSTNQTLGDSSDGGAPRRYIGLDLAYAEWHPFEFFKLYAGRIPQLHYRPGGSQVLLDEDISLEGSGFTAEESFADNWRVFLNGGSVYIRENYDAYYSEDLTDNMINWMQAGLEWKWDKIKLTAGSGFYNFTGLQGKNYADLVDGGVSNGNSEQPTGVVKNPYLPRQYFLEGSIGLGSFTTGLFAERIINSETRDPNAAWWFGASLSRGAWDGQFAYCEVQKDAVPALFTYSDFGNGTTDTRGIVASVRWKFTKGMSFKVTEFVNRIQASTLNKEYNRTHLDISASF